MPFTYKYPRPALTADCVGITKEDMHKYCSFNVEMTISKAIGHFQEAS